MTTTVTIAANHGWPVRVTRLYRAAAGAPETSDAVTVAAGKTESFAVWDGCDLRIHEIQPAPAAAAAPPDP